jgi:hypothetical protein
MIISRSDGRAMLSQATRFLSYVKDSYRSYRSNQKSITAKSPSERGAVQPYELKNRRRDKTVSAIVRK